MSKNSFGSRSIESAGDLSWTWRLSGEPLDEPHFPNRRVRWLAPAKASTTETYIGVPNSRALIDDLLGERQIPDQHWRQYSIGVREVSRPLHGTDLFWSEDQLDRANRYLASDNAGEEVSQLARFLLREVEEDAHADPASGNLPQIKARPGVPLGLGRVVLDPSRSVTILLPPSPKAPTLATAGRLIEELVWVASILTLKNPVNARNAINLAQRIAEQFPDDASRLQRATLLAVVAHIQRRMTAPLVPRELDSLFTTAIRQLRYTPAEIGMPWEALDED